MGIQFNPKFFDELARGPGVTKLLVDVAEKVADNAREAAPRDSGDYADSIHVEVKHQRRSVALVVASDPKSMLVEAKTGNLVRSLNKQKKAHRA